jgi:hypothetical protein
MARSARRTRWIVLAVLVLVVVGAVAAVVLSQPDLSDARDRVDTTWTPLRGPLDARYDALAVVNQALTDAGAGDRAVAKDLGTELQRWATLAAKTDAQADAAAEAQTAGELEALARRVRANVLASDRLNTNAALQAAIGAYDQAVPPPPQVAAYNRAARRYEDERTGVIRGVVARVLGYDARPQLVLGP